MALLLGVTSLVLLTLVGMLAFERVQAALQRRGGLRRLLRRGEAADAAYDPGRELRAENRARRLLRSCVNEEEWEMYRDLGFIRVWGGLAGGALRRREGGSRPAAQDAARADYAYLIYPHRPIVAYLPQTGALLNEYCVAFPDSSAPYGSTRLPASDDVLAKWMGLKGDERHLISEANMHLPGRQIDPEMVRRDLRRLARWERERLRVPRRVAAAEPRAA
jgi:hypothetical protein